MVQNCDRGLSDVCVFRAAALAAGEVVTGHQGIHQDRMRRIDASVNHRHDDVRSSSIECCMSLIRQDQLIARLGYIPAPNRGAIVAYRSSVRQIRGSRSRVGALRLHYLVGLDRDHSQVEVQ